MGCRQRLRPRPTSSGRANAVAVGGQQHGMVAIDAYGGPVRDALLWDGTRSAAAAAKLWWPRRVRPQACLTRLAVSRSHGSRSPSGVLLPDHEPERAAWTAEVLLPHDFVSQHLSTPGTAAFTDRGDASGTGYFATAESTWRPDLATAALGHEVALPRVISPGRRRRGDHLGRAGRRRHR